MTSAELLYRKAVSKKGNDWRQILRFLVDHRSILEDHIAERYLKAWQKIDYKEEAKGIRNRLWNIGPKTRDSPETQARELRNVFEGSTAKDLVVKMKNVKQLETVDPLNTDKPCCSKSLDGDEYGETSTFSNEEIIFDER